ncbi:MAG: recombinase family protein, partial [Peptostreptococcaceae bacterium]
MKTIIYLRKSRSDEQDALRKHRETLFKVAKEKNLTVLDIKEEIVSGENIKNRPKMLQLLEDIENKDIDAVLVVDIDRLGRGNMQDQGLILDTFKNTNTKIITPRKIYDLNNEFDEEYSEFESFLARKELKMITRRMQRGREKALLDGYFMGSTPPFGYDFAFTEKGRRIIVVNEQQAEIVRLIYKLHSDDFGSTKIANYLNKTGYKSAKNLIFTHKAVSDIIRNKVYAGYVVWGKRNKKRENIVAKGIHESIIDEKTFNFCNDRFQKRDISPVGHNKYVTNPLAGLVKCAQCNHTLVKKSSRTSPKSSTIVKYLVCTYCSNRSTKLDIVEEIVLENLEQWLLEYKQHIHKSDLKKDKSLKRNYEEELISVKKEISKIEKQKENLHDFLEQGVYDIQTYLERSDVLNNKIESTNNVVTKLEEKIALENKKNTHKDELIPKIEYVLEQYKIIDDLKLKNKL